MLTVREPLLLASQSPRRQELLRQIGVDFVVGPAAVEERVGHGESAADYAVRIALEKARAGAARHGGSGPALGADTDVVFDGRILGKPRDRDDALAMLAALSDREHEVYSAVALVQGARSATRLAVTRVRFGPISATAE
jgi:septum formation protein